MRTLAVQNSDERIYIWSLYFQLEPQEKCMIFKDIFPGLSRTLSFNFQDFRGPEILKEKIHDFPGGVGTLLTKRQQKASWWIPVSHQWHSEVFGPNSNYEKISCYQQTT